VKTLSVVIPILDEKDNIPALTAEVDGVLDTLAGWQSEVVWVDDGSTDGSYELLREISLANPRHKLIRFRRNFGQTAALAAGFEYATGSVIITLDGDRQNDPRDIATLLAKVDEGYDVVSGWRKNRQDSFMRKLPSRMANWLISRVTGVHLHDYGCTLKAYRAEVANNLQLHGDLHRFIPALASWYGVDVTEVVVNHRARTAGRSKYGIGRTPRVMVDLITVKFFLGYSARPGHLFGPLGLLLSAVGSVVLAVDVVQRLFFGQPLANRPSLLLAVLLVVLGLQFVGIGLIAEMIMRASRGGAPRDTYAIRELVGEFVRTQPGLSEVLDEAASHVRRFDSRRIETADQIHDPADRAGSEQERERQ
jgi:glycosyltransferase involved in cell wall biosynthesis